MIILREYPLNMIEHYSFRKLCKTLQPGFKVPCRNTTRNDIILRYATEKELMIQLLDKAKSKIALTTDMWTSSNQRKGYMAVTAYFISNTWKLQSRILRNVNKYWSNVNTLLAVETVLDPRYKIPLVRYYYKQLYEDYKVDLEVEKVKYVLKDLTSEYGNGKGKEPTFNSKLPPSGKVSGKERMSGFAKYLEVEENQVKKKSKLEKYFETPNVPLNDDFDILVWWKINGSTFPILQRIVRDILSIPVSSVASESVFSTGGRVLTTHRSNLLSSTVEALMCAQNRIWTDIKGDGGLKEVEYRQIIDEMDEEECITEDEVKEVVV